MDSVVFVVDMSYGKFGLKGTPYKKLFGGGRRCV
jgi:hypothetical protein